MSSSLAWLDHDAAARDRSLRILALFQEKDTRDELGLGGVRDSIADLLFPGTSTIQTRLRYFLFIPWVYKHLEEKKVPASQYEAQARALELRLVRPLMANEDQGGIFGKEAGGKLQRLPSSVYWAGLRSWGLRRFDLSQNDYHRSVDSLYVKRRLVNQSRHAHDDATETGMVLTWHPQLPEVPTSFSDELSMALTHEEAGFLRDCIVTSHKESLLATLTLRDTQPERSQFPWLLTNAEGLAESHRELLHHARLFSELMHGASILYNLSLAALDGRSELESKHLASIEAWAKEIDKGEIADWDLSRLWELIVPAGYSVTPRTKAFIKSWKHEFIGNGSKIADSKSGRDLIRYREISLKKARSRFKNTQARQQWGGSAGMNRLSFRWGNVQTLLSDLWQGLNKPAGQ